MIPASTSRARNLIWKAGATDRGVTGAARLDVLPAKSRFCKGAGISRWSDEDMRYSLPGELPDGWLRKPTFPVSGVPVNAVPLPSRLNIVSPWQGEKKFFKLCNYVEVFLSSGGTMCHIHFM